MSILSNLRFENFYELVFFSIIVFYILTKDIKAAYKSKDKLVKLVSGILILLTTNLYFNLLGKHYSQAINFIMNLIQYLPILIYWIFVLTLGLYMIETLKSRITQKIIRRKLYHFLALLIYLPGFYYLPDNILLAISGLVFAFFLLLEKLRNNKLVLRYIPQLNGLTEYLKDNIDGRDREKLILTHTFLLFSCFYTLLMKRFNNDNEYIKIIGIIILSIGDSAVRL
jgi:hypothetical protein